MEGAGEGGVVVVIHGVMHGRVLRYYGRGSTSRLECFLNDEAA